MRSFVIAVILGAGLVLPCVSDDKPVPKAKERHDIEAAATRYDKDVAEAREAYREAIKRADKRLLDAYEKAVASALRRGDSAGLDLANELNAEKKKFQTTVDAAEKAGRATVAPPPESLIKLLTSKTWYSHWEQANRDRPFRFKPDGTTEPNYGPWSLEQKWVVNQGGSQYLIPIDDKWLRGFFVPTAGSSAHFRIDSGSTNDAAR